MKRFFDLVFACLGLLLLSTLLLFLIWKIRRNLGSPIFFRQPRPGISGWAQVNGRDAFSWDERFKLDVRYVDHRSLRLDINVFWIREKEVNV